MTTVVKRNQFPVPSMFDQGLSGLMRNMLREPLFSSTAANMGSWVPAVEVAETNDTLVLTAELPGMEDKDLKLSIENNVLTISGEKEQEVTDAPPTKAYYISERYYGAFQRSFALPRTVDVEHVEAVFKNGVLTISLPKLPESKGRQITISKK